MCQCRKTTNCEVTRGERRWSMRTMNLAVDPRIQNAFMRAAMHAVRHHVIQATSAHKEAFDTPAFQGTLMRVVLSPTNRKSERRIDRWSMTFWIEDVGQSRDQIIESVVVALENMDMFCYVGKRGVANPVPTARVMFMAKIPAREGFQLFQRTCECGAVRTASDPGLL